MKDYVIQESWTKECVIENVIVKRGLLNICKPFMIVMSGEILMLIYKNALLHHNPRTGSFKKIFIWIKSKFHVRKSPTELGFPH